MCLPPGALNSFRLRQGDLLPEGIPDFPVGYLRPEGAGGSSAGAAVLRAYVEVASNNGMANERGLTAHISCWEAR